jgi:ABC-type dipeptide/oligopeptide/nickel transport system ATPase subunit
MAREPSACASVADAAQDRSRRAIEVRDLVKRYPKASSNAVDAISFAVAAAEVFGLLAPKGVDKPRIGI